MHFKKVRNKWKQCPSRVTTDQCQKFQETNRSTFQKKVKSTFHSLSPSMWAPWLISCICSTRLGITQKQAKPSRLGLACITKKGFLAWLGLACKFKKRALAWFWLGISSGNSSWLYLMTFQPWHQNQTFSESLKLIVLWNLITIYKFFLSFEYWLGPTCNIILTFRLGLAWLVLFLEIKRLGLAWFGFFWCSFGLAWLGLEYFYHMKAWLGLACSEKTRLDDP